LHAGFSMLVALFLIFEGRRPWRRIWMLAYPIAMGLAIVYCAEHYVIDVVLGWAYAGAVMLACGAWERQRDRRRLVRAQRDSDATEPSADADPDVVGVPAG
jgi:membrane-associated phospholipid phosphatase